MRIVVSSEQERQELVEFLNLLDTFEVVNDSDKRIPVVIRGVVEGNPYQIPVQRNSSHGLPPSRMMNRIMEFHRNPRLIEIGE